MNGPLAMFFTIAALLGLLGGGLYTCGWATQTQCGDRQGSSDGRPVWCRP